MYTIVTFTFIDGNYMEMLFTTREELVACKRLEWALELENELHNREDLHRLLRIDEMGLPLPYRVKMPGYEDQPPTYLTFTYTP